MKTKIALYKLVSHPNGRCYVFDYEPVTAGFFQVSEWVEIELPELAKEFQDAERAKQAVLKRAALQAEIEALSP